MSRHKFRHNPGLDKLQAGIFDTGTSYETGGANVSLIRTRVKECGPHDLALIWVPGVWALTTAGDERR